MEFLIIEFGGSLETGSKSRVSSGLFVAFDEPIQAVYYPAE
jgi:hypothetical protein